MVKLIAYTLQKAADPRSSGRDSRTKYRQLAKSLAEYIGPVRDVEFAVQAREGWLEGYHRFLCESYTSNKDAAADPAILPDVRRRRAADHLRTLRRINFNAAAEGIIPDVDFLAGIPGGDLARSKPVVTPDFEAQIRSLVKAAASDPAFARAIDRYLLALHLCGLPPALLPGVVGSLSPSSVAVRLPHLGVEIPLSPDVLAKALAVKARIGSAPADHSDKSAAYDTLFRHLGIILFRSGSPFTDWLSLASRSGGASSADIIDIMRLYDKAANGDLAPMSAATGPDIAALASAVSGAILRIETNATARHYYAVKVYGASAESELAALPEEAPEVWSAIQGHVWCPCTTSRPTTNIERIVARRGKVVDERRTVMRDLFFASATTADIARLDRIPNLWVFQTREGTARRYTRISPAELRAMRAILDRIGPSPDIEFSITDAPPPSADFLPDDTVRLLLPGFEDIEARITKKITTPSSPPTYLITFLTADGKHIRMTVPPSALAALTG